MTNSEEIANEFLEVASEQRVSMLLSLAKEKYNLSGMAKRLDATAAEIHRNFGRLQKAGLIKKDANGNYELTLYGKTVCAQIPAFAFMSKNKKYFESHDFTDLAQKYIQRIGALADSEIITGYVKVMEKWESIYKSASEYICNILIEIPYNENILKVLEDRLKHKTRISSIFSESAVISKARQDLLSKFDFAKYVKDGILERRMRKDVKIALILNEKEAGVSFPSDKDEPDLSKMFYSSSEPFHEWCLDYFNDSWKVSTAFQETKLKH
ncbi:MAG TPA: transcriptional regulator [Candidatus Nitrosotenuis sp.]|nr:transcriptional regulator [Candidatus Nitrosotenuis sp.]